MDNQTVPVAAICTATSVDERLSASRLRLAESIFDEITSLAYQIDRECYFRSTVEEMDDPIEEAGLALNRMREAVRRMGWLADFGSDKIGGSIVLGGAEDWLLSPVCAAAAKEVLHG